MLWTRSAPRGGGTGCSSSGPARQFSRCGGGIDRAYGKPVQQNNGVVGQVRRTVCDLSDAQLLEIIERSRQSKLIEAQAIEVEPTVEPQPDVGVDVGNDT